MMISRLWQPAAFPDVPLAPGERLLWQGRPSLRRLLCDAFHIRLVAVYFVLLILANGAAARTQHLSGAEAWHSCRPLLLVSVATLAIVAWMAVATWRATAYTITTRKVVLRFGIALPVTLVLPNRLIGAVSVRVNADHTGDIPLRLLPGQRRLGVVKLWPYVRPWGLRRPQPMLRCVPMAGVVAAMLSRTVEAAARPPSVAVLRDAA